MKVVKCENYIPEEIWGKVIDNDQCFVEDSEGYLYLVVENEAFPLPEVGDKVYVSEDGKFSGAEFEYRGTVDNQHVCRDEDGDLYLFRYVKPLEPENSQNTECRESNVYIDGVRYVPIMRKEE